MKNIVFERQDLRRIWLVLGAIESSKKPTLSELSKVLDMQMSTLQKVIERINSMQMPDTIIAEDNGKYIVESWGVANKRAIIEFYNKNACATLGA